MKVPQIVRHDRIIWHLRRHPGGANSHAQADRLASADKTKTGRQFMSLMARLVAAIPVLMLVANAHAVELDPKIVGFKLPDQIQWSENTRAGNRTGALQGDPTKPGT